MSTQSFSKDLVVVAADTQMQRTVETLLQYRRRSLAINTHFSTDAISHPNQDSGCRADAGQLLEPRRNIYGKAIVIFDYHGCGERRLAASELETSLESEFVNRGWGPDRIAFIVLEPELEAWLFGASFRHIERAVGWSQPAQIQDWLIERGHLPSSTAKPPNPKAAIDAVLYQQKLPRSAKLFGDLARNVSLARCQDRAFQKLRSTLQRWFPAQ